MAITALSSNREHTQELCERLDLGVPHAPLKRVYGGFHHTMWRLETGLGEYAIKQLSAEAEIADAATTEHYDATEAVAQTFAGRGIPAIYALQHGNDYVQLIEDARYLVYPWTDAVALGRHEIAATNALQIAGILATMHRADVSVPRLPPSRPNVPGEDKLEILVRRAKECNVRDATLLAEQLPNFLRLRSAHRAAVRQLEQRQVISHGDADHRNVLWSVAGEPVLIDWESARRLNPTYEIILEALDWSGITATFQPALFEKMLAAYTAGDGQLERDSLEASFHCVLGDWLNWLMYNVGRSFDLEDDEQRQTGAQQVDLALSAILRLQRLLPKLLTAAHAATAS